MVYAGIRYYPLILPTPGLFLLLALPRALPLAPPALPMTLTKLPAPAPAPAPTRAAMMPIISSRRKGFTRKPSMPACAAFSSLLVPAADMPITIVLLLAAGSWPRVLALQFALALALTPRVAQVALIAAALAAVALAAEALALALAAAVALWLVRVPPARASCRSCLRIASHSPQPSMRGICI